ncbi:hypothetical protein [Bosea sp. UNC402CLCol]|uniref:hypothetical protein n=1 Tax=unclassified Bosea (in: a-proteobacteria) TaxID=2653178 RepID=UPI00056E2A3A|nr:hypothetical protein [Bosea sp. UNC402CLCol]
MHSFASVIDAFGVKVVAELLGVKESHVRVMKTRGSIPAEYWGLLIEAAPEHGISGVDYPLFRQLRSQKFAPAREVA